ncbi:xylulokinase [Acidisoma cladoniae]|jgi:xylulokinase|uniref:xylulokinase n=1 Tax=Acidisoma cladoniae TaxID=3040935 RepID=UPI00255108C7|nr:xylulokinase [Acidisoma sp. PAMC 29798]
MYLGIDLGTSGIKAVLVDDSQTVLASHTVALDVSRPHPGWSEQAPEDWWQGTLRALDALTASHPSEMGAVRGVGLSGQMHGAVLLDAAGMPLRPAILWNDTRCEEECLALEDAWPDLRSVTGNVAMPGFTAPKLVWVRRHEPEIFAHTAHVLLPKAYVRYRLTGEMIEEMSDAAGTLWLDVGARAWSEAGLAACGMTLGQMPRLVEGSAPAGRLTPELTRRWGMTAAPVLAGGAGDNAAGAVGLGAIRPGSAFVSLGTSGVLWATTDRFRPNPDATVHAFCHALPGLWHQMGVTLSAAASLAWWSGIAREKEGALLQALPPIPSAPSDVTFLPYLSGERTPHNDGAIRGGFLGLSHDTTRDSLTQAVLEGVAFSFRDCLDALRSAGTTMTEADVIGGGSRSATWIAILASVLGITLHRLADGETGGAFGAARLGRLAVTGEDPVAVCTPPRRIEAIAPVPALQAAYEERLVYYRALYPALRQARRLGH